jgi:anaerobic selenocysteine-containing dehydrogenase
MSLLDRPISEFDGPIDSVRVPVVPVTGDCKPFQDVLIELAGRLGFPVFTRDGKPKFKDYEDFVVNFETEPGSGQGFLIGWRGKDGDKALVGEPNPRQWEKYAENNCFFHFPMPESMQYMRNWNQGYHEWAQQMKLRRHPDPPCGAGARPVGAAASGAPEGTGRKVFRSAAVFLSSPGSPGHREG